jgi:hypothetical protein
MMVRRKEAHFTVWPIAGVRVCIRKEAIGHLLAGATQAELARLKRRHIRTDTKQREHIMAKYAARRNEVWLFRPLGGSFLCIVVWFLPSDLTPI